MHGFCGLTKKGVISIPTTGMQGTLHAMGLARRVYSTWSRGSRKTRFFICPEHLADPANPPSKANVLPFAEDPICQRQQPGRNSDGDEEFRRRAEEAAEKAVPRTTSTSRAAGDASTEELKQRIRELEQKLDEKSRQLARTSKFRPFSWDWLLDAERGRRVRVMSGSSRLQLVHLRACLEAAGARGGYDWMYGKSTPGPAAP